MSKVESLILGMFFGFLPVLLCVAVVGFINVRFFEEKGIAYWALAGLCIGVFIDVIFLKGWVRRAYRMNSKVLALLYIFYSIGVTGFCMGVPILNFPLGMAAGIYTVGKMAAIGADEEKRRQNFRKTAVFAAVVMGLMCCLITLWAIAGQMIGYRFESPLVSFTFTVPIFSAVVVTGGTILVLLQYWLTVTTAKVVSKLLR